VLSSSQTSLLIYNAKLYKLCVHTLSTIISKYYIIAKAWQLIQIVELVDNSDNRFIVTKFIVLHQKLGQ